jgi:hypothetical protein
MTLLLPCTPFLGRDTNGIPTEVGLFVPADAVFPGTESSERSLIDVLSTLSRDDTLFFCARVNTLVSGPGDFDFKGRQQRALSMLCTPGEIDRVNAFARAHPHSGSPTIFFRGQLLELIRWAARYCRNLPGDGITFTEPTTRSQFVKAALIAGMVWSRRVYGDRLSAADDIVDARRRALGAFRKGVEEGNLAPHLGVTLGRGWSLFNDYFPRFYPAFAADFLQATGLTLEQYLTCTSGLATYTIFDKADGPLFLTQSVAGATAYREILPAYLAIEAQTPARLAITLWNEEFERFGYRSLRERPIMVTEDGRGVILDPTFYLERISIGPLFYVLARKEQGKANEIFGAFGLTFEKYATDILRRMYPHRASLVDRVGFNILGRDGSGRAFEIDAALHDVTEAAVFEMKAGWVREDTILDVERFLNEIQSKYGALPNSGEREKGVAQLARSIRAIVRGEWSGSNNEFRDVKVIYPVLVVHDVRMGAPGIGHFLAEEFVRLLGAAPATKRVAPLTLMTIDDLENMESSVEQFSMCQLLADYSRECPDRLRSLHNYIAFSDYGAKVLPSGELIKSSMDLIQRVQQQFFPREPDAASS